MKAANTQLIEDIKKTIVTVEAADFAAECWEGYEEQAEENQESVLIHLSAALEYAQKGLDYSIYIQEAWSAEQRGCFDPVYTESLFLEYGDEDEVKRIYG